MALLGERIGEQVPGRVAGAVLALTLVLWWHHVWAVLAPTVVFYLLMLLPDR